MIMNVTDNLASQNLENAAPGLDVGDRALNQPGTYEGMIVVDLWLQPVAFDRGGEAILSELNQGRSNGNSALHLPPEMLERLSAGDPSDLTAAPMRMSADNNQYSCRVFV